MAKEDNKKRVAVESLGWLTESSIMPKKHRLIEGVGATSIMELKAQLYQSQEESKKSRELGGPDAEYQRAKKKLTPKDAFSAKNTGVDARDLKDKLELKAVNDGSASYAALERKAELYNKLVKGELSDEEDKEKYCVDFFRKGFEQDEPQQPQSHDGDNDASEPMHSEKDGDNDATMLFHAKPFGPGRTAGAADSVEHKRFVREVHEEANRARVKASEIKLRRQEQVTAHREKLKQAYLRKKLEQLRNTSKGTDSETKQT